MGVKVQKAPVLRGQVTVEVLLVSARVTGLLPVASASST
jgi:hypothetical protein